MLLASVMAGRGEGVRSTCHTRGAATTARARKPASVTRGTRRAAGADKGLCETSEDGATRLLLLRRRLTRVGGQQAVVVLRVEAVGHRGLSFEGRGCGDGLSAEAKSSHRFFLRKLRCDGAFSCFVCALFFWRGLADEER